MKQIVRLKGSKGTASAPLPFSWKRFFLSLLAIALAPVLGVYERYCVKYANHKGSEGTVKVGANAVAEIRSWEVTETNEVIEDTTMADTSKTFKPGNGTFTGSLECWWDETDTNGQEALTRGAEVTLNLYPEGDTTGDVYYTGTAIVTSISRRAGINSIVEANFSFQGSGALTRSTAS